MKYLELRLSHLLSRSLINILACDISYRHTGVCVLSKTETRLKLVHSSCIDNNTITYGFAGYYSMTKRMLDTKNQIERIKNIHECSVTVCEMPTYGRSMNAGMAIGICWGVMSCTGAIFISPDHLKEWSESKKGDGKKKVKEKVMSRIHLDSYSNDNIIDAIGTALMISDLITILKNETNK